jgi:hypothetical protein
VSQPNNPYQQPEPGHRRPSWGRRHKFLTSVIVIAALAAMGGILQATGQDKPQAAPAPTVTVTATASAKATVKASADAAITAHSYASARSLLAAMDANGAACTGANFITPTVAGAVGQIADCSGASNGDTVLAVFTGHAAAAAYARGVITLAEGSGGTPTGAVTGPDWAVNTSPAFARKVVKAIGGRVIFSSPAPTPVPAPATQAPTSGPSTVAAFSGQGAENTPQFTVTSTWKLDYSYDCADAGGTGNFIVTEDGGNDMGGLNVNALSSGATSSTWAYNDAGSHYLSINSECSWSMKVVDEP